MTSLLADHPVDQAEAEVDRWACYRQAIARFATGVAVITTDTPDGPAGMTASAVFSLSLEPAADARLHR